MTEIKFRIVKNGEIIGYERYTDTGWEWSERSRAEAGRWKYEGTFDDAPVIHERYTGMKDRKGKEIYEGDIVVIRPDACDVRQDSLKIVDYGRYSTDEPNKFRLRALDNSGWSFDFYRIAEVYGNVHEDAEAVGCSPAKI